MERGSPMPWPLRSPDITPLDFFLKGYVKNIVYQFSMSDTGEMESRNTVAIQIVDLRTWIEISYTLDVLNATDGMHIEIVQ
ncbi:uncharacterized protein TNCV_4622361 [Trichonephila clavipes]|nr:uncharacterized protein TNCV_4622361 [Trichonephila clavipes]